MKFIIWRSETYLLWLWISALWVEDLTTALLNAKDLFHSSFGLPSNLCFSQALCFNCGHGVVHHTSLCCQLVTRCASGCVTAQEMALKCSNIWFHQRLPRNFVSEWLFQSHSSRNLNAIICCKEAGGFHRNWGLLPMRFPHSATLTRKPLFSWVAFGLLPLWIKKL